MPAKTPDPLTLTRQRANEPRVVAYYWPFVLSVGLALGCSSSTEVPSSDVPEGKTIVYEGLPHPNFDPPGLLESEKSSKQTTVLHGCYFYKSFQPAKDTETNELRELLADPLGFSPFSGEKKCGGFHADYAVAWKENGELYEVLICFGCGEVKRFGPRGTAREDMNHDTEKLLKTILKMYDRDRPAHRELGPP